MSRTNGLPSIINPVLRANTQPSASRLEQTDRLIRGSRGVGGTRVRLRPWGLEIDAGSGLDLSKFCLGLTISGPNVTILSGEVTWGKDIVHTIAETTIEITADLQYVGIEATYTAAGIIGPSIDLATFRSDDTTKRTWMYLFTFRAGQNGNPGSATLSKIGKPVGNWDIGSEFSP